MQRDCLAREVRSIATPVGPIRFKIASRAGRVLNASPEFEDCAKAAAEHGLPDQGRAGDRHEGLARREPAEPLEPSNPEP